MAALVYTALLVACAAAPALASTAPRYASPAGTSTDDCTTPATACDIVTAIDGNGGNDPVDGQEIVIEPGTYTLTTTLAPTVDHLDVHGVTGQPRPVIEGSDIQLLHPNQFNERFSYLEFRELTPAPFGDDVLGVLGGVLDRLLVEGAPDGNLCQCYDGVLRNSVLITSSPIGAGAWGLNSNGGNSTETLRNDTLIATTADSYALAMEQGGSPTLPTTIDAENVIAINTAGGHDVFSYGPMATVNISNSDFSNPQTGNGGVLAQGSGNVSAAPQFIDAASGDYRELPGSPTVDAGTDDTINDGTVDYGGNPRMAGGHTDMGAFEYQPPAAVTVTGGQLQSAPVAQPFAQPLSVRVTDAQGNAVPDSSVTFTAPPASATFAGSASVRATTGLDGVASVAAPTAGTLAGTYAVTAAAGSVSAPLSLRNLPGPIASLKLTPSSATAVAGNPVAYSVETFDRFANDTGPAGPGLVLSVAPDGSCAALSCTALAPGPHTVTATLGGLAATSTLEVTSLAPGLTLARHSVHIARRTRSGWLAASCAAPAGEFCAVTGKLSGRVHHRSVVYGTISGQLGAGVTGRLRLKLTRAGVTRLRTRPFRVRPTLLVSDSSGTTSLSVALELSLVR